MVIDKTKKIKIDKTKSKENSAKKIKPKAAGKKDKAQKSMDPQEKYQADLKKAVNIFTDKKDAELVKPKPKAETLQYQADDLSDVASSQVEAVSDKLDLALIRQEVLSELKKSSETQSEIAKSKPSLAGKFKFSKSKELKEVPEKEEVGFLAKPEQAEGKKGKKVIEKEIIFEKPESAIKIKPKILNFKGLMVKIGKGRTSKEVREKVLSENPPKSKTSFKSELAAILWSAFLTLIFLFFIIMAGIYLGGWQGTGASFLAKILPLPALIVNGQTITVNEFFEDQEAVNKFLDRAGQKSNTAIIKQQVISSLIEKSVIKDLAEENNLDVSQSEIDRELDYIFTSGGEQSELESMIKDLYGWDFEKYLDKVIKPVILASKLEENFYNNQGGQEAKRQIQDIYGQLQSDPESFAKIAAEVNQDETKYTGGDLGWLFLGQLPFEIELSLLDLEPGQISEIMELADGFLILKLEDKIIDQADSQTIFHARQIFLPRNSFSDYLSGEIKKAHFKTLIKI